MAFEYKYFPDGDAIFELPKWKRVIEQIQQDIEPVSYIQNEEKNREFQENEVGIKHPKNGSFIRIKDDGTIEAFTAYGTGIRIKTDHTSQLFSDRVQLIGRELDIRSSPNGTNLNGEVIGQGTYQSFPYKKGLTQSFLLEAKANGVSTYGLEDRK